MISNQILQSTIEGLKEITKIDMCILDAAGQYLANTYSVAESLGKYVKEFAKSEDTYYAVNGKNFFKIYDDGNPEYIVVSYGEDDAAKKIGEIATFQVKGLLAAYKERFDSDHFFKNLLLDNLLLVDIYNRAKKLHIDTDVRRVIFIIELPAGKDGNVLERVRAILLNSSKEFVTAVDEKNVIIVKELGANVGYREVEMHANQVLKTLEASGETGLRISYGTIVGELKEVSKSYKEGKLALEVGKIFFHEKHVIAYNKLGIGRLIYQLPIPLCKMFIREIFEGKSPDDFDEETLTTIDKFFENSLNVSETSRQLFVHRNTLVYRLDKIQKLTGLDLRVFEDAITFKIAMMVVKYMKHMETMEY